MQFWLNSSFLSKKTLVVAILSHDLVNILLLLTLLFSCNELGNRSKPGMQSTFMYFSL